MTRDELIGKKQTVSKRFDELKSQQTDITTELNRLQGEYRVYEEMEQTLDALVPDLPPNTISAEPTLEKEAKRGK